MVNTDVCAVTLYKNSTLAKAELIDQAEICSTEGNAELPTMEESDKELMLTLPEDISDTEETVSGPALSVFRNDLKFLGGFRPYISKATSYCHG